MRRCRDRADMAGREEPCYPLINEDRSLPPRRTGRADLPRGCRSIASGTSTRAHRHRAESEAARGGLHLGARSPAVRVPRRLGGHRRYPLPPYRHVHAARCAGCARWSDTGRAGLDEDIPILQRRHPPRTLGGRVGDIGQQVEGEAVLAGKQPATFFLKRRPDGTYVIVGMAQGHYVIEAPSGRTTERRTLRPLRIDALVPRLGHTLGEPDAARVAVTGKTIAEVRALIAKERANAR